MNGDKRDGGAGGRSGGNGGQGGGGTSIKINEGTGALRNRGSGGWVNTTYDTVRPPQRPPSGGSGGEKK